MSKKPSEKSKFIFKLLLLLSSAFIMIGRLLFEGKKKEKTPSGYWVNTQVKTDKDGDTVIVIYVGHEGTDNKSQFFVRSILYLFNYIL